MERKMNNTMFIKFVCPRALWTERETLNNPKSYPIPTLEAVRGMIKSIYRHPGIEYAIHHIQICSSIEYGSEIRNERKDMKHHTQKSYAFLKNYVFIVEFKIVVELDRIHEDNLVEKNIPSQVAKAKEILRRRIAAQKSWAPVVAGQMQYPVIYEQVNDFEPSVNPISFTIKKMYVCMNYDTKLPEIHDIDIVNGKVQYDQYNKFFWNDEPVMKEGTDACS